MKKVVIVCSGNTCRSPMAAALIEAKVAAAQLADKIQVSSAGVTAADGEQASEHGVALLAEREISLAMHRSRRLKLEELEEADLLLVMTAKHREALQRLALQGMDSLAIDREGAVHAQMRKVLLFSELIAASPQDDGQTEPFDIADPYGESKDIYSATLLQLEEILEQGWSRLLLLCGEEAH